MHTTKQSSEKAKRWQYSSTGVRKRSSTRQILERLKKHRVKCRVRWERAADPVSPPATPVDLVQLTAVGESEFVNYPASLDDLRNLLSLLPGGVVDGLTSIDLCLGTEEQEDHCRFGNLDADSDPYTGRLGNEMFPGAHSAQVLGVYYESSCKIKVFAYVYGQELPDRPVWELYFRLRMLATLVHEIGHHYDATMRAARGRWFMFTRAKVESYAEGVEYQWLREYVLPYLRGTYPVDVAAFEDWVRDHGGAAVTLEQLLGDPRTTMGDGLVRLTFPISDAVEALAEDVYTGLEPIRARVQFARELHYGEHYSMAMEIIDRVLTESPDDQEALILKADIYEHQGMYDLALPILNGVIARDSGNEDARSIIACVYRDLEDWPNIERAETWLLESGNQARAPRAASLLQRCRARIHLGRLDEARVDLADVEEVDWTRRAPDRVVREVAELKAMLEQCSAGV